MPFGEKVMLPEVEQMPTLATAGLPGTGVNGL